MDSDIQFGDIEHASPQNELRPDRNGRYAVIGVGVPGETDLPIFVDIDVMRDMEAHAQSNSEVELGGVLLGGQYADDEGKPFVVVLDCLRAQHYQSTKGSFKFTHETWEQITREREQLPAELRMVGWYHTHPGWGVFLSGMDQFICDNFFNRPLDVALVIDPCRKDRGFFQWTNDAGERLRRTEGFYLIASRFRAAELMSDAAQLESKFMAHDHRSSADIGSAHPPVIHFASPIGQTLALLGMLSLQFCFLMLIAWRLIIAEGVGNPLRETAAVKVPDERLRLVQQREADINSKLEVLDLVVRQGTGAPEGVLKSLAEQTAQVNELRASLRGQQSLTRELDGKVTELQAALADSQRRESRHQAEISRLEEKLTTAVSRLEESRAELETTQARKSDSPEKDGSWSSTLVANSKPMSVGAVVGAVVIGAVMIMAQRTRKPQVDASGQ